MYEIYHLHTEPFRLSPDPAFCYEHQYFRKGHAYMKHALAQGDGVLMITGHPGTGKTMLIEYFMQELGRSALLTATLINTQVEEDDLYRMVGYSFGLDMRNLDRATILHNLQEFLLAKRRYGHRALLIVDEAQGLSSAGLEQLRMLTNLKDRSQPLLQLFLIGQEQLIDVIRAPEMEPLYQRLIAAAHLKPLCIDDTSAYVRHRLRCAGWEGEPLFSKEAMVLIHRFSAGYPRLINKICGRALLYGSVEQKPQLVAEDILNTLGDVQDEYLMPGNDLRGTGASADSKEMLNTDLKGSDWTSHLTPDERAFLEKPDPSTQLFDLRQASVQAGDVPHTQDTPQQTPVMPEHTSTPPSHRQPRTSVPVAPARRHARAQHDTLTRDLAGSQLWGWLRFHGGWKNPWIGLAASGILGLLLFSMLDNRSSTSGGQSTAAVQFPATDKVQPVIIATASSGAQLQNTDSGQQRGQPSYDSETQNADQSVAVQRAGAIIPAPPQDALSDRQSIGTGADMAWQEATDSETGTPIQSVQQAPQSAPAGTTAPLVPTTESAVQPEAASKSGAETAPVVAVANVPANLAVTGTTTPAAGPAQQSQVDATDNSVPEAADASNVISAPSADRKVDALLASAEHAYQRNRLTLPRGRSAFDYYGRVLKFAPHNASAVQGIKRIVSRYQAMAQRALQREEFAKAQTLAARGLRIDPNSTDLLRLQEEARYLEIAAETRQQQLAAPPPLDAVEVRQTDKADKGFWGALKRFFTAGSQSDVSETPTDSSETY